MNYRFPTWDSTTAKTIRTVLQVAGGFVFGLFTTVWGVPGVPEAVQKYLSENFLQVLVSVGFPTVVASGALAYLMNYFKKGVKNY